MLCGPQHKWATANGVQVASDGELVSPASRALWARYRSWMASEQHATRCEEHGTECEELAGAVGVVDLQTAAPAATAATEVTTDQKYLLARISTWLMVRLSVCSRSEC